MHHSASAPHVGGSAARARGRTAGISFAKWAARRRRRKTADAAWTEEYDAEHDVTYFYNHETGESTWHDPRSTAVLAGYAHTHDYEAAHATGGGGGGGNAPADHYDVAGYTDHGFPPKPSLLVIARSCAKWKKHKMQQYQQEVAWVRGELVNFERQKQAELRAEIQRLQEELEQSGQARDHELTGMLTAFSNISDAHEKKRDKRERRCSIDRHLDELWEEHQDVRERHSGALLLERERQRHALQERLEKRRKKHLAKRLIQIDQQLEEKRKETNAKLRELHNKFAGAVLVRDQAMRKLRKVATAVRSKPRAGSEHHPGSTKADAHSEPHVPGYTPWVELICEETQHKYWYNHDTGAAQWTPPPGWDAAAVGGESFWGNSPEHASHEIEEAVTLAEEWVTEDELAHEQQQTAELEQLAAQMRGQANLAGGMSANELFDMLEGFMELEDEEEHVADKADRIYERMKVERAALEEKVGQERERQKQQLAARLEKKRELILKRRRKRVQRQLRDRAQRAALLKRIVKVRAAVVGRRAATTGTVVALKTAARGIKSRARALVQSKD